MKIAKKIMLIILFLLTISCNANISYASQQIKVYIDGNNIDFDTRPIYVDDRVYVPLRSIFEALGATVDWNDELKVVTCHKAEKTIILKIDDLIMTLNNKKVLMDVAPIIFKDRTMVPVRFVAQGLGAKVEWDNTSEIVRITAVKADKSIEVIPSFEIPGQHNWQNNDTEYCRFYFDKKDTKSKEMMKNIDFVYNEVTKKFKHHTLFTLAEDALVPIYFLDGNTFSNLSENANWSAYWSSDNKAMFVNNDSIHISALDNLFRHEFIHAVTLSSLDTKVTDVSKWFREGIARYYEQDIEKGGGYDYSLVRNAIRGGKLLTWKELGYISMWKSDENDLYYSQSASIIEYLMSKWKESDILNIFYTDGDFESVLEQVTSLKIDELEAVWLKYITQKYK